MLPQALPRTFSSKVLPRKGSLVFGVIRPKFTKKLPQELPQATCLHQSFREHLCAQREPLFGSCCRRFLRCFPYLTSFYLASIALNCSSIYWTAAYWRIAPRTPARGQPSKKGLYQGNRLLPCAVESLQADVPPPLASAGESVLVPVASGSAQ